MLPRRLITLARNVKTNSKYNWVFQTEEAFEKHNINIKLDIQTTLDIEREKPNLAENYLTKRITKDSICIENTSSLEIHPGIFTKQPIENFLYSTHKISINMQGTV